MSMILKSYDEGIVLPPEGSDEWFALLPGWSGWMDCNCPGGGTIAAPLFSFASQTTSYMDPNTADITVFWNARHTSDWLFRLFDEKKQFIWGHQYCYYGGYYYFAGVYCGRAEDDTEAYYYYKVGRATSLEPQI